MRIARSDVLLGFVALLLGAAVAAGYAAWRAVSLEGVASADRWAEFADAMVLPGSVIIVAVAAMVWLGWKANID